MALSCQGFDGNLPPSRQDGSILVLCPHESQPQPEQALDAGSIPDR